MAKDGEKVYRTRKGAFTVYQREDGTCYVLNNNGVQVGPNFPNKQEAVKRADMAEEGTRQLSNSSPFANGRQKAEAYLNSRAQAVGVENASPGAKFTVIYKGKTGLEVSRAFGAYYIYKDGKSYEFMRLDQAKRAADTGDMSFGFVQRPLG